MIKKVGLETLGSQLSVMNRCDPGHQPFRGLPKRFLVSSRCLGIPTERAGLLQGVPLITAE